MNDRPKRVLIAEWVPSSNKGELAILIGMLKTFEALGSVDVSIFSYFPSIDRKNYPRNVKIIDAKTDLFLGNSLFESSRLVRIRAYLFAALQHLFFIVMYKIQGKKTLKVMNRTIWREYSESDIIIICHDQLNCVDGFILRFSPIYLTLLAKALRKPIVIYANGADRFRRKTWKILAKFVLTNVNLITVRDKESFSYLKKLIPNKAQLYLTADPAILLPPVDVTKAKKIMIDEDIPSNDGILIGAIISHNMLLNCSNMNEIRYKNLITEITRAFDRLIEHYQASIVFIPHCIGPSQRRDDRIVSKEIYNFMKNKQKVQVIIKEYSPEELKGLMGQLDLLISARVHAAIGALSMNVPTCVLTVPSDRRAYGLIGKMLKQEKWIYNIENLNSDGFFNFITELLFESGKIRKNLPSIVNSAKQKALLNGILLKALSDS